MQTEDFASRIDNKMGTPLRMHNKMYKNSLKNV